MELTEEEREECKKPLGSTEKRASDKAFNSTMKELQRVKGEVPPSGPWKPSIRPRLVHLYPNKDKRRKVVLLSGSRTAEAESDQTPESSTSEEQHTKVFGPSDREKANQEWIAKMRAGVPPFAKKKSGTYSASSSSRAPAASWDPYIPGSSGSS